MRSEEEAVKHASECWAKGYNCAESVLRGVCFGLDIELPDVAKMMATPFGGGVGRSEDICGALVAGVMGIGAYKGRTQPDQDKFASYEAAGILHRRFRDAFGSTCCGVLNKGDFKSPEHRTRCGGYVGGSTSLALQVLRG